MPEKHLLVGLLRRAGHSGAADLTRRGFVKEPPTGPGWLRLTAGWDTPLSPFRGDKGLGASGSLGIPGPRVDSLLVIFLSCATGTQRGASSPKRGRWSHAFRDVPTTPTCRTNSDSPVSQAHPSPRWFSFSPLTNAAGQRHPQPAGSLTGHHICPTPDRTLGSFHGYHCVGSPILQMRRLRLGDGDSLLKGSTGKLDSASASRTGGGEAESVTQNHGLGAEPGLACLFWAHCSFPDAAGPASQRTKLQPASSVRLLTAWQPSLRNLEKPSA